MPSSFVELPPVLDNVRVASPCAANWETMAGDDRRRFCDGCQLHVYDLSAMQRSEAEQLLGEQRGSRLCVRFFRRSDGTVLTQDCPVGLRAVRQRLLRTLAVTAAAVVSLVSTVCYGLAVMKRSPTGSSAAARPTDLLPTTLAPTVAVPEELVVQQRPVVTLGKVIDYQPLNLPEGVVQAREELGGAVP